MPTEPQVTAPLQSALAASQKTSAEIQALQAQLAAQAAALASAQAQAQAATTAATTAQAQATAANQALTAAQTAAAAAAAQATADKNALLAQVADLKTQLATTQQISQQLLDLANSVNAQANANDALIPDLPGGPVVDDAAILAEVTDNTDVGVNKRLGSVAPVMTLPDVYERPLLATTDTGFGKPYMGSFSQGLAISTTVIPRPNFDYGSTDTTGIGVADLPLAATPNLDDANAVVNSGVGVYAARTEEHSNGQVSEAPVAPWNMDSIPHRDAQGHVKFGMRSKLGRPVAIARGKNNRYDVGVVLYDESRGGTGYFGTVGTATAQAPWSGTSLPAGKIPLSIAVSSQNEFVFVGVHDRATGKGQIGIYWNWAGNDLQQKEAGKQFPPDFPKAHPGLMNSGVITGCKLFGFFDLPIKWPTSIGAAFSRNTTSNRIQGPDGNASYLNIWPLDTASQRSSFLAQNDGWISSWGKAVVGSRYEDKVVTLDLTALVAGVRDQYFGSQAKYDETAYNVANGGNGWDAYGWTDPMKFPWGVEKKPEWAPTIKATINVSKPSAVLMSEDNQAQVAVASPDGYVRFYQWDGSANGSIRVGDNPVHLSNDKYPDIRSAGLVVTCRASRSVVILSKFGPTASIVQTIQDNALLDPVAAEIGDMHGAAMKYLTVADYNGKQLVNYRLTNLTLATQGGAVFTLGTGSSSPAFERGGRMAFPAKLFGVNGSNVN